MANLRSVTHCLALLCSLGLAGCAAAPRTQDAATFSALAEASMPREGLTREMLKAIGEVARQGTVSLILDEVGREKGYGTTWEPGNLYYDRASALIERSMEPMLSRMDPTPLLERNLTRSLERHLSGGEARELVTMLASPEGKRFTEYLDATMAAGMLSGIAGKTPTPFRSLMVQRLEPLRPRLAAAQAQSKLTERERLQLAEFSDSALGRKLGRAYLTWAESMRGEWTADLRPRAREVRENLVRSAEQLRAILHEYELWRSGSLREA